MLKINCTKTSVYTCGLNLHLFCGLSYDTIIIFVRHTKLIITTTVLSSTAVAALVTRYYLVVVARLSSCRVSCFKKKTII